MADKQHITLGPKGAAWIVLLVMPQYGEDAEIPEDQMLLIGRAAAFEDERLRELVWKLFEEKSH
jgi:hypothetical protein